MATTLKPNILLLSSKRSQNLCIYQQCRFKSVKFREISRFSCFKVESFIQKTTSHSKTSPLEESTSKDNYSIVIGTLNKWLKLKIFPMAAVLVMGSFLLMPTKGRDSAAWAVSGGVMGGGSFPSSSSSPSSSSYDCSTTYIYNDDHSRADDVGDPVAGAMLLLFFFSITIVIPLIIVISKKSSISKIQVGLLVNGQSLKNYLNLIAKTAATTTSTGREELLDDTIDSLNRHRDNWVFGYSSVNTVWDPKDVEKVFNRLCYAERKKFDKETLVNLPNMKKESKTSRVQDVDEFRNTYMVVTILVSFPGNRKVPIVKNSEDLDQALKKLKIYNSKITLMGVNVLWTPQKANEILSREKLQKLYPLLRPFNK
ncbi:hypothetical protein Ddye_025056 [Dipteronia dyeriana]|uniref:Uncharacterized protein n=1 Tax=Dipteronia dyeriana TaxID=168575 RepID=A0AAD9WUS0_9ROSI|nr:hypothetical protein Ddye_025056 [Dipteronia dyeriana]